MTEFRIAVPIVGPTLEVARQQIADSLPHLPTYFEVRIDRFERYSSGSALTIIQDISRGSEQAIATCRHRSEAGPSLGYQGTDTERVRLFEESFDRGAILGDWELAYLDQLPRELHTLPDGKRLIISTHNFQETPSYQDLEELFRKMLDVTPHLTPQPIFKIATMAKTPHDVTSMYQLLARRERDFPTVDLIGICMGEHGGETRIYGPAHGSYLTFATVPGHEGSAPGQLSIDKLVGIWDSLGYER